MDQRTGPSGGTPQGPLRRARLLARHVAAAPPPLRAGGWGTELVASAASAAPEPEPRRSWEAGGDVDLDSVAYGFMASQALFAALELGLFDHVAAAGPAGAGAAALGAACGVEGPRLLTLLTALVALKCLRQAGGFYTLSPNTARYMVRTSKAYYGDYLMYQIGRQFYATMGQLPEVMKTGRALTYASWFSDPAVAETYTRAQHNGSLATARSLIRGMADLAEVRDLLDVGGGSGAFSYAFAAAAPALQATVLELPEVCCVGEAIRAGQPEDVRRRVRFVELDATSPSWPVADGASWLRQVFGLGVARAGGVLTSTHPPEQVQSSCSGRRVQSPLAP